MCAVDSSGTVALAFQWTAVDAASAYDVWVSAAGDAQAPVAVLRDVSATNSAIRIPRSALPYTWCVQAKSADGRASWSAPAQFTLAPAAIAALPAPDPIAPKGQAKAGKLTFEWTAAPGATGYDLWIAKPGCVAPTCRNANAAGTECTVALPAGVYVWSVRATGGGACSPWSAAAQVTAK
jgi:hypothetical protein